MSIRKMLRDSAKHISEAHANGVETEVRTQAVRLSQFAVGLVACRKHDKTAVMLQKTVAKMLEKGSVPKRLIDRIGDLPKQKEAVEDVRLHCQHLTFSIEEAAEGDLLATVGETVLGTENELRDVVRAVHAWLSITTQEDWDTEMDFVETLEAAQEALSKLNKVQEQAARISDVDSNGTEASVH